MKTIVNHELAGRNESELSVLFHIVSRHLALTAPCSPERRNVYAHRPAAEKRPSHKRLIHHNTPVGENGP